MSAHGYHGKMLKFDLTSGSSQVEEPDAIFYRNYPGPALYGTYYLLKETAAGADPFAPGSLLIFGCGVAGGNLGTGLARFGVVGKSPLSGGIFESRCEGPFARGLKGSGYDALILRGKSETPSYLLIDGGPMQRSAGRRSVGKEHGRSHGGARNAARQAKRMWR